MGRGLVTHLRATGQPRVLRASQRGPWLDACNLDSVLAAARPICRITLMKRVYPKVRVLARTRVGRCFELAYRGLWQDESGKWQMVHGYVRGPWGYQIEHAWLLRGDEVYDPVHDEVFTAAEYSAKYAAEPVRLFSLEEAAAMASKAGHYGSWIHEE
jgi:hypothetical protein